MKPILVAAFALTFPAAACAIPPAQETQGEYPDSTGAVAAPLTTPPKTFCVATRAADADSNTDYRWTHDMDAELERFGSMEGDSLVVLHPSVCHRRSLDQRRNWDIST